MASDPTKATMPPDQVLVCSCSHINDATIRPNRQILRADIVLADYHIFSLLVAPALAFLEAGYGCRQRGVLHENNNSH